MSAFIVAVASVFFQLLFLVGMMSSASHGGDDFGRLMVCEGLSILMFMMVPWVLAIERKHKHRLAIFWLSLLLGWTILGWVIALVWACMDDGRQGRVHITAEPLGG